MLAKFNHLPKIEMNEHEETHDPATWFLTSSISDGDFCMALIWQNNPGSLSLSLSLYNPGGVHDFASKKISTCKSFKRLSPHVELTTSQGANKNSFFPS